MLSVIGFLNTGWQDNWQETEQWAEATVKCMKVDIYEIKQEMDSNQDKHRRIGATQNDDKLEKKMWQSWTRPVSLLKREATRLQKLSQTASN